MEEILFWLFILLLAFFVKFFLFPSKRGVVALDLGGVFTKGDYFTEKVSEREGMRELVKALKKNYNVVLLTNQNAEAHRLFEKKLGLSGLFDEQIVSGRVGIKKPDPRIFKLLLHRFNAAPSKATFVDDDASNVEAAKKLGIAGIHFSSLPKLVEDFRKIGIAV